MGVKPVSVPQSLAYVLTAAGDKNGVDFDYLLQTAIRESSLNPKAKAQTSSATGLFQFLESTWLEVMKEDGPRLGYQTYADAITVDGDGDFVIKDKEVRQEVLALREDPAVAADLAAAFTAKNGAYLQERFGRMPSPGELYIAHFLGAKGAEQFFAAGLENPDQIAAKLFPKQAKANPTIFYELGEARTIRQVYRVLVSKHENGGSAVEVDPKFAAQQMATDTLQLPDVLAGNSSKWPDAVAVPSRFSLDDMSFTTLFSTEGEMVARPLVPFPAPVDLLGIDAGPTAPLVSAYTDPAPGEVAPVVEGAINKPRVLMTKRLDTPAIQVVTNLYGR